MADAVSTIEKLRTLRTRKDLTLKRKSPYLRERIKAPDGSERDFVLRYYQIQMVAHLLAMKQFVVGDDMGTGKTVQAIAGMAHIWTADPKCPKTALILTIKSAVMQWAREIERFTDGIGVFVYRGSPAERDEIRAAFNKAPEPKVLLMGYRTAVRDFAKLQDNRWGVFCGDEIATVKNPKAQVHQMCRHLAGQAERAWGLTGTLLKNKLVEGWAVFRVIKPGLFTHGTETAFINDYGIVEMLNVGRGKKVPKLKGYKTRDIIRFREKIEPYYLGRAKHDIATELPTLTTREIRVGLSPEQAAKYGEALSGLLNVNGEEKEVSPLTAVTYCQEIVNHPALVGAEGGSTKLDTLIELLTEGDLVGEKVIIFTRFEKMVGLGIAALEKAGVPCLRITGKETKEAARQAAMDTFQDPDSGKDVIWITTAGSDAINLQAAKAVIFFDTPYSAGVYLQCLDDETEVLTRRGFVGRREISRRDEVAAFRLESGAICWRPILSVVDRELEQEEQMFEIASRHNDIRVTGGHRMLFKRKTIRNKKSIWPDEWRLEPAEDMARERTHFQIPVSGVEPASGLPLSDQELEFVGWFLSDGSLNRANRQVVITQAVHQPQIHDLRRCLKDCGFDWSEYHRVPKDGFPNGKPQIAFSIPKGNQGGTHTRNGWVHLEPYLNKDLDPVMEAIDARQLGHLLRGLHLGDGGKWRGQKWTQRSYHVCTGNQTFANRLQSLCVRRGYRCNITTREDGNFIMHIKQTGSWALCGGSRQERAMRVSKRGPSERVWCIENDVGTLVTRRHGKVAIVGNCLGRMIRIGSIHDRVYAIHLVATDTVDEDVLSIRDRKMVLIEMVLGKRLKGEEETIIEDPDGGVAELFTSLQKSARRWKPTASTDLDGVLYV